MSEILRKGFKMFDIDPSKFDTMGEQEKIMVYIYLKGKVTGKEGSTAPEIAKAVDIPESRVRAILEASS